MKMTVALFLTLASVLVGFAQGEYRVKVHPPIPPPPMPPFKFSPSASKGGGHRWTSNSLGPPRFHPHHHHHHHPPGLVHHHVPHGPTITVHHHGGPNPPKPLSRPFHALHGPHHHQHHHHHLPPPLPAHPHPHPPPSHPPNLVLHHHHHHVPPPSIVQTRPSFKAPWKGPPAVGVSTVRPVKDTFHPSPPDGAQMIVATHQTVDDNKGPIHTIPAPNLGPSGMHPQPRPVANHGSVGGGNQGSGFQTGHGIGQGSGDAGGPYPNPVYGKPVMADLTYHEPKVAPEVDSQLNAHIPTIKIESSHGYQVHESSGDNLVTPAPMFAQVTTLSPGSVFFAPDPDPSLPAAKIPYSLDPHSHPSNGQFPPDLVQEIPQHLLTLYGVRQPTQDVHLQPQVHAQEQHQVHPQLSNIAVPGEVVHQGSYLPSDFGGQLILSQALAQFDVQSQPEMYSQVSIQQQQQTQQSVPFVPDPGTVHHPPLPATYVPAFEPHVRTPTSVSVQQAPLVSSTHETVYQKVHPLQIASVSDGQGGHVSAYDLFANSPVNSPVLDSIKENFHLQYTLPTPATPSHPVGNAQFQFHVPVTTTVAPPTSTPASNGAFGHHQQFISTTAAPPVLPPVNNIEYQPQVHDFSQSLSGQSINELYHNLGAATLEGHQPHAVSVTNPGQAGYIAASYHSQQTGNVAIPQVQTHVFNYGHDSFSAETRQKATSVEAAAVNSLAKAVVSEITLGPGSLRKGGVETVRPSSSSFYPEKTSRDGSQSSNNEASANHQQETEEDPEYYDEDVSQEVDSEDEKRSENPQPVLPSSYAVYEPYVGESAEEEEKNEQEYEETDSQHDDYSTQTKSQNEGIHSNLDNEKTPTRKLPSRNYDRNVEYGIRLRPKKNN